MNDCIRNDTGETKMSEDVKGTLKFHRDLKLFDDSEGPASRSESHRHAGGDGSGSQQGLQGLQEVLSRGLGICFKIAKDI